VPQYESLKNLVDYFAPNNCQGVEIGVDRAITSIYMLENSIKLGRFYCIDPYLGREPRYQIVKDILSQYENCSLIRLTSHDASKKLSGDLDFVFIDGNHSYEYVLQDLIDWVPKLKSGGLLIGHDWCDREPGVSKAGNKYFDDFEHLFKPLMSNEDLNKTGLFYHISGPIHRQNRSKYPLWWRIKK